MTDEDDKLPMLLLQGAAQGTAAKILITHLIMALAQKGVLTPSELGELMDASKAFAEHLGGPPEFVEIVLDLLDPGSRRPPEEGGDLH